MRLVRIRVTVNLKNPDVRRTILLGHRVKDKDAGLEANRRLNVLPDCSLVVLQLGGIDHDLRELHVLRLRFLGARQPAQG